MDQTTLEARARRCDRYLRVVDRRITGDGPPKQPLRRGTSAGVLGGFVRRKLAEYVEPTRTGVPRGEPIGLSRQKFHAALLAITSLDLKTTAKDVGVSYGLLRKWRTEEPFLKQAGENLREFIDQEYFAAVLATASANSEKLKQFLAKPTEEITQADFPPYAHNGFADARFYGKEILVAMTAELVQAEEAFFAKRDRFGDEDLAVIAAERRIIQHVLCSIDARAAKKVRARWNPVPMVDALVNFASSPLFTEEDRRFLVYSLRQLRADLHAAQQR